MAKDETAGPQATPELDSVFEADEEVIDLLEVVKPGKPIAKRSDGDMDFSADLNSMLDSLSRAEQSKAAEEETFAGTQPFPDPTPVSHEVDPDESLEMPGLDDLDDILKSLDAGAKQAAASPGMAPPPDGHDDSDLLASLPDLDAAPAEPQPAAENPDEDILSAALQEMEGALDPLEPDPDAPAAPPLSPLEDDAEALLAELGLGDTAPQDSVPPPAAAAPPPPSADDDPFESALAAQAQPVAPPAGGEADLDIEALLAEADAPGQATPSVPDDQDLLAAAAGSVPPAAAPAMETDPFAMAMAALEASEVDAASPDEQELDIDALLAEAAPQAEEEASDSSPALAETPEEQQTEVEALPEIGQDLPTLPDDPFEAALAGQTPAPKAPDHEEPPQTDASALHFPEEPELSSAPPGPEEEDAAGPLQDGDMAEMEAAPLAGATDEAPLPPQESPRTVSVQGKIALKNPRAVKNAAAPASADTVEEPGQEDALLKNSLETAIGDIASEDLDGSAPTDALKEAPVMEDTELNAQPLAEDLTPLENGEQDAAVMTEQEKTAPEDLPDAAADAALPSEEADQNATGSRFDEVDLNELDALLDDMLASAPASGPAPAGLAAEQSAGAAQELSGAGQGIPELASELSALRLDLEAACRDIHDELAELREVRLAAQESEPPAQTPGDAFEDIQTRLDIQEAQLSAQSARLDELDQTVAREAAPQQDQNAGSEQDAYLQKLGQQVSDLLDRMQAMEQRMADFQTTLEKSAAQAAAKIIREEIAALLEGAE